jgi:hypothetical protein
LDMKKKNKEIDPIIPLLIVYFAAIGLLVWWSTYVSV